jgi:hexosaminidase
MFDEYLTEEEEMYAVKVSALQNVDVLVASTDDTLQMETDESYTLNVKEDAATITSKTIYGALRAIETFSQLIYFNFDTKAYELRHAPWQISGHSSFPICFNFD